MNYQHSCNPIPNPQYPFEKDVVQELEALLSELPAETATLNVGRVPGHPEWPEPYFEVVPNNPLAARINGIAVANDLNLTIGGVECELIGFGRGGTIVRGATWQEELRWIWHAVVAGSFSQKQSLDSNGRVIGGTSTLQINGKSWTFQGGKRAETLISKRNFTTVVYEPYCK